jgi:glycosyltransferase involved in cell wall biosynthesis
LKIAEKIACGCATQILAVSESLRDSVLKYELTKPSKITVLHHGSCNGVDAEQKFNPANVCPAELDKIRQEWQLQHFQSIVGFVGRLTLEKGIQELYDAWQIVKTTHPHACLMLVGGEDEREKLPKSLKTQLEKDPSIVSIGAVESVAPYYALMDFMVLPSHREGFGNVVIEAAAMTKPTVATYVTGLKDAVKANETGLFCTPHCPEDLADKIQTYLQNPTLAYTHGQAARKRVRVAFVPQNMWRAKLQLYRRLWAATQSVPLWHVSPSIQTAD